MRCNEWSKSEVPPGTRRRRSTVLIEEKNGPRSPTFAPVAAPLVYLLELAAFLIGERQCFGFAGQGEAFGRRGWQVYAHKSEDLSGSAYVESKKGRLELHFLPLIRLSSTPTNRAGITSRSALPNKNQPIKHASASSFTPSSNDCSKHLKSSAGSFAIPSALALFLSRK